MTNTQNLNLTEGLQEFVGKIRPGEWHAGPTTKVLTSELDNMVVSPRGFKLLVRMYALPEKTSNGLYLPEKDKALHDTANICAEVIAMGSMAYADKNVFPEPWCRVGQWVLIHQYTGTRFTIKGESAEYRLISDSNVEAVVSDPNLVARDLGIHG